jgi:hypothetical protein
MMGDVAAMPKRTENEFQVEKIILDDQNVEYFDQSASPQTFCLLAAHRPAQ